MEEVAALAVLDDVRRRRPAVFYLWACNSVFDQLCGGPEDHPEGKPSRLLFDKASPFELRSASTSKFPANLAGC
jgi:hypothetical protein